LVRLSKSFKKHTVPPVLPVVQHELKVMRTKQKPAGGNVWLIQATLPLLLKQLGLPMMYKHYEAKAEEASEKNWAYTDYLSALSHLEVSSRRQKRIQRHLKRQNFKLQNINTFDFKVLNQLMQHKLSSTSLR